MSEARVKKERIKRQDMPIQDAKERKSNFNEVALGYSEEQALLEASRCLACKKPLCVDGCPVDIDIPAFIKFISEKEYQKAIEKIKEKNNLPAICGRVCPQESQCEKLCIVGKKDKPVAIGRLERFYKHNGCYNLLNFKRIFYCWFLFFALVMNPSPISPFSNISLISSSLKPISDSTSLVCCPLNGGGSSARAS
jgi:hypothetical protein